MATVSTTGMIPGECSVSVRAHPVIVTDCTWDPDGDEAGSSTFVGVPRGATNVAMDLELV